MSLTLRTNINRSSPAISSDGQCPPRHTCMRRSNRSSDYSDQRKGIAGVAAVMIRRGRAKSGVPSTFSAPTGSPVNFAMHNSPAARIVATMQTAIREKKERMRRQYNCSYEFPARLERQTKFAQLPILPAPSPLLPAIPAPKLPPLTKQAPCSNSSSLFFSRCS